MADNQSADFPLLVSRSAANDRIRDALRLYVGRGRRYSVKQLSNGTGVKDRTIECAMYDADDAQHRRLAPEALLSICKFLGAGFTSEVLFATDQGAFDLSDGEPDPGSIAIASTDDNASVVRAAMDGEFCSDERDELRAVGLRMVARGTQLAALRAVA
jgi:hypothetical protein